MSPAPAAFDWRPERITVVGLGLLGASIVEASRKRWPKITVVGVSSQATLAKAKLAGLIDDGYLYDDINLACAHADLVLLCTPIDHILSLLQAWVTDPPRLQPGALITDVGSTKSQICFLGRQAFKTSDSIFIGSHPMAGSEKTGLEARDALLFQNASWVICPTELTNDSAHLLALKKLTLFAQGLGARTTQMTAELHDQVAAHVSHLPQLLATALASYIGDRDSVVENCLQMAGGGFRDMTRLAASSFQVWEPILRSNQETVLTVLSGFRKHLENLEVAVKQDFGAIYFSAGQGLRAQLSTAKKGFAVPLVEILVDLEDQPGTLVKVFGPLAAQGINVLDVEILKVREGEEGTLMLGFHKHREAQAAMECLNIAGFRSRIR